MFGGKGMGGGSGNRSAGGNILRTVGKVVTGARVSGSSGRGGGFQEPTTTIISRPSSPTSSAAQKQNSSNYQSLSSSPFSSHNQNPVPAGYGRPNWGTSNQWCDEYEWVSDDDGNEKARSGFLEDFVGFSVPSLDEVHGAISAFHQVFCPLSYSQLPKDDGYQDRDMLGRVVKPIGSAHRVSSSGSDGDWIEPSLELQLGEPRILLARGVERVYDAFHLLETDPLIQRTVLSISSDKAVWDAILNNETVQHLRNSLSEAKDDDIPQNSESKPANESTNVIRWIFDNTKTKAMDVIERITELVNYLFQIVKNGDEKNTGEDMDPFEEKLRTSAFISIIVLLVVVLTRTYKGTSP